MVGADPFCEFVQNWRKDATRIQWNLKIIIGLWQKQNGWYKNCKFNNSNMMNLLLTTRITLHGSRNVRINTTSWILYSMSPLSSLISTIKDIITTTASNTCKNRSFYIVVLLTLRFRLCILSLLYKTSETGEQCLPLFSPYYLWY